MKHTVPQVQSIQSFLEAKGWETVGKDKATLYLKPPAHFQFEKPVQFEMPAHEDMEGYRRYIMFTISSIAEMYDLKYEVLYDLFCYDYQDVEKVLAPKGQAVAAG